MALERALDELSPEQRAAVTLCLAEGWSHGEAAQALGLTNFSLLCAQVRVPPAATAPRRTQTIDLWGVTDRSQAGRAANGVACRMRHSSRAANQMISRPNNWRSSPASRYGLAA